MVEATIEPHELDEELSEMLPAFRTRGRPQGGHPLCSAYTDLACSPFTSGVHVVQQYELPGGESVCVIRTGGLRRLQRRVRRLLALGNADQMGA